MLNQIAQIHRQACDVIPTPRLFGRAMAAQIGNNDVESCSERVDVTLEDLA